MSSPDDARFRPGGPTPDDDDVGAGYREAPLPRSSAPPPYGAIEEAPAPPPRSTPTIPSPSTPTIPPQPRTPRRPRSALLAAAVVVLLGGAALIASVTEGSDDDDAPTGGWTTTSGMPQTWSVTPADLSSAPSGSTEFVRNPDGAFTGPRMITGDTAWVIAWTTGDSVTSGLAAIDPASGAVLWDRPLARVVCADQQVDGALLCLALDGDTWVYHRIDATTGADLATAATTLENVQTVHAGGEGLVVIGSAEPAPHAQLSGLGPDGTLLWSFDVATTENADLLFTSVYDSAGAPVLERPRWRDLDGGLVMLWSTPGVAIIDPGTGATFVHECRAATPMGDHYYCQVGEDLHRYALDGSLSWSSPGLRPAVPEDASDSRLVALGEPTTNRFEVVALDQQTGQIVGDPTYRFDQQPGMWTGIILPPTVSAEPDATFVVGDSTLIALDPETSTLLWTLPHDHTYVGDIVQIGDVAVVDTGDALGLDLATGRVLWEHPTIGDLSRVGDALVSTTSTDIILLEMP
ncbi:outer membrane protein assembly factor BamB family protein [Pseudactinotalea suaedae]|uniref:outer membrane protein assembly factor BamB family protein n=1 Tax=Pseudactinotalea suaedae TaxID=1524924 RepID=UPI0012E2A634|nr:PQQ-binding-like beta-propeller repeat protein [Pseudactinotalea suaedae]